MTSRTGHPASVNRGRFARRNFPIGGESAEVIDADDVGESQRRAEPRHPPSVSTLADDIPSVQRIAPALAGLAEVIGRDAGHDGRFAVVIELKELAVRPHVGAVAGDIDRDVAENVDSARVGGFADRGPLSEKQELYIFLITYFCT